MGVTQLSVAPSALKRRRTHHPKVRFPLTISVDLRPTVARFDSGLAVLSRWWGLRTLGRPLARWTRRLVIDVHKLHRHTMGPRTPEEHEILRLAVSNGLDIDATGVRFQTRWTSDSPLLQIKTEDGLWFGSAAGDMGHATSRMTPEADLLGRGHARHLALAVKYLDDHHAYLVTPRSYQRSATQHAAWRWPALAIAPGLHIVDIAFRGDAGGAALIRLKVLNPGRGGRLMVERIAGSLGT